MRKSRPLPELDKQECGEDSCMTGSLEGHLRLLKLKWNALLCSMPHNATGESVDKDGKMTDKHGGTLCNAAMQVQGRFGQPKSWATSKS